MGNARACPGVSFCFPRRKCYFAHGGKVTKTPPGDAFGEHFAFGGVPRRLSPGPPATRVCHFGLFVISGGQNQDLFPVYSRATGPFYHQNFQAVISSVHRLVHPFLLGAAVVELPPAIAQLPWLRQSRRCPYSADTLNFHPVVACAPEARRTIRSCLCPPDEIAKKAGGRPP